MLSFNAGKTTATDMQLQLNRRLCRPPSFPYKRWFCVLYIEVSCTRFSYEFLVQDIWIVCQGPNKRMALKVRSGLVKDRSVSVTSVLRTEVTRTEVTKDRSGCTDRS